jgi:hypothetical protein
MTHRWILALVSCLVLLAWGCDPEGDDDASGDDDATADDDDDATAGDDDDATAGDDDDSGSDDDDSAGDDDDTTGDQARWTYMVFMNGDNDLESWVVRDLNELEQVGSGDDVHVVVQADRIPGYDDSDGDWTGTRRYYIQGDSDMQQVGSPVLEELGELDMGDPLVLSEFVMWAHENYPAERMALVLWDHGDGWTIAPRPQEIISWDDTDGGSLSIADGDLRLSLEELVAARGMLDVIGFDACNMASWEVGHSLRDQVAYMVGSSATVGMQGLQYGDALALLRDVGADPDGRDLADNMARTAVEIGNEWTFSATDLGQMDVLAAAMDDLAGVVLGDPSLESEVLGDRDDAHAADFHYETWYVDLRNFAVLVSMSDDAAYAAAGQSVVDAMDTCIVGAYGNQPMAWNGGLTTYFDLSPVYFNIYANADNATWSQETRWDDLLQQLQGVH